MYRWYAVLLLGSLFSRNSQAQVPSLKPGVPYASDSVSSHWYVEFKNNSPISIISLVVLHSCESNNNNQGHVVTRFYDNLYGFPDEAGSFGPGADIAVEAQNPRWCSGEVEAALYSDGHNEGTKEGIAKIFANRKGVYSALESLVPILDLLYARSLKLEEATDRIKMLTEKVQADPSIEGFQRSGMLDMYSTVDGILRNSALRRAPEVDALMIRDDIPREQAYIELWRDRLRKWQSSLAGHLQN